MHDVNLVGMHNMFLITGQLFYRSDYTLSRQSTEKRSHYTTFYTLTSLFIPYRLTAKLLLCELFLKKPFV